MSDDVLPGGALPDNDNATSDEFDPDAVDSDIFLDDEVDGLLDDGDMPGNEFDDDDDDILDE